MFCRYKIFMTIKIQLGKFGEMLVSRPAGREAYLSAKAYLLKNVDKNIEIDFEGVKVLTPSWIDEFVTLFKKDYPEVKLKMLSSNNPSVSASLKMILP